MFPEHLFNLVDEDACRRFGGFIVIGFELLLSSSAEEYFAFWKESSKHGSKGSDTGGGPEKCTPGCARDEVQIDESGDDRSSSVSLLNNTATKATSLNGDIFECACGG